MIETDPGGPRRIVTIYDDIYNLDDPRDYFRAMRHAGFRTAHHAVAAFFDVRDALMRQRGLKAVNVLDFASGYGIAALLMRHRLTLDDVLAHYTDPALEGRSTDAVAGIDRDWLSAARRAGDDRYAGIDIADRALAYGERVGVFDAAFPEDLAAADPSPALAGWLARCDLVVEVGSVAHMLPAALARVLDAAARRPWVVTAPIRGNDTAEAIEVMQARGMVVEQMPVPPFRHRRFADATEQARAIANAQARGHDTEGVEDTGYFHAQLFLARPEDEATPIADWPAR